MGGWEIREYEPTWEISQSTLLSFPLFRLVWGHIARLGFYQGRGSTYRRFLSLKCWAFDSLRAPFFEFLRLTIYYYTYFTTFCLFSKINIKIWTGKEVFPCKKFTLFEKYTLSMNRNLSDSKCGWVVESSRLRICPNRGRRFESYHLHFLINPLTCFR